MAENVIFETQNITGFAINSFYGAYSKSIIPIPFELVEGEEYKILWDDVEYTRTAFAFTNTADGTSCIAVGNKMVSTGVSDGDLFAIVNDTTNNYTHLFSAEDKTEHSVAIYQVVEEVGIITRDRNFNETEHYGMETVTFDTTDGGTQVFSKGQAVEGVEIALDFSGGDQTVKAADGTLVKSAVIKKPDTLKAENIVKDVEIAGVVGTSEGGGGGGGDSIVMSEPEWIDDVCFWDYDGTLILHLPLSEAKNLTELPTPPEHTGLTFQEWNHTLEDIWETEYPLDIGATYTASDGNTHVTLIITNSSYRAVPVYFMQSVANGVSINWGDGSESTSDSVVDAETSLTHTYSAIGTYEVVITVSEGCIMTLGGGTSSTRFVGGSNWTYTDYVDKIHIGNNVLVGAYSFYGIRKIRFLTIPKGITELPQFAINQYYLLKGIIIPRGVITIGNNNIALISTSRSYSSYPIEPIISLPATVEVFGTNVVYNNGWLRRIVVPHKVVELPNYCICGLKRVLRIFLPRGIKKFGNNVINNCNSLPKLTLPESLESVGNNVLYYCLNLQKITLPNSLQSIGDSFCRSTYLLAEIVIPESVESIGTYFLVGCGASRIIIKSAISTFAGTNSMSDGHKEIIFTSKTPTSVMKNFLKYNFYPNVYVPDESLSEYESALGTSVDYLLMPLSEYKGILPEL